MMLGNSLVLPDCEDLEMIDGMGHSRYWCTWYTLETGDRPVASVMDITRHEGAGIDQGIGADDEDVCDVGVAGYRHWISKAISGRQSICVHKRREDCQSSEDPGKETFLRRHGLRTLLPARRIVGFTANTK